MFAFAFRGVPVKAFDGPLRSTLDKAAVGYEAGKPILKNVGLITGLDPDDRVALLGRTARQSTLAKLTPA